MWNVKREFSKQQETMEEKEIRCPKCKGNKFSFAGDNAFKCAFCGTVFQVSATQKSHSTEKPIVVNIQMPQIEKNYITIHGYDEWFIVNPTVSVYKDGVHSGTVGKHGQLKLELNEDCHLKFSCGFRSAKLNVAKGIDTHVFLYFNRFTGSLNALKSGNENLAQVARLKEKKSTNVTILSIFFVAFLFFLLLSLIYH